MTDAACASDRQWVLRKIAARLGYHDGHRLRASRDGRSLYVWRGDQCILRLSDHPYSGPAGTAPHIDMFVPLSRGRRQVPPGMSAMDGDVLANVMSRLRRKSQ